jgi:hypothetical protein
MGLDLYLKNETILLLDFCCLAEEWNIFLLDKFFIHELSMIHNLFNTKIKSNTLSEQAIKFNNLLSQHLNGR